MKTVLDNLQRFSLDRRSVLVIGFAFAVALILRWGYIVIFFLLEGMEGFHLGVEIPRIAGSIADGDGFSGPVPGSQGQATAWTVPIYPYFLSLIFSATENSKLIALSAAMTNGIIGACTVFPIYFAARQIQGERAAAIAGLIFAVEPTSIWLVRFAQDTTMIVALIAFLFPLYNWAVAKPTFSRFIFLGLFVGIMCLVKTVALVLVIAIVFLTLVVMHSQSLSHRATLSALVLGCVMLVSAPWVYRNVEVMGLYGFQSNFGLELMVGNNTLTYEALVNEGRYPVPSIHPNSDTTENQLYRELGEKQYMANSMEKATDYIFKHPEKFAELTMIRIFDFWSGSISNFKTPFHRAKISTFICLMVLSIFGIAMFIRNPNVHLMIACLLLLPAVYYVTHTISIDRYRLPVIPSLTVLAACAAVSLSAAWMRHRRQNRTKVL